MSDWATIASMATAGGTLVLAMATFSSVRSANRTAQIAERSMLLGLRPVLIPSRDQDPVQEILYGDGHLVHLPPGVAAAHEVDGNLYLTLGLRNVGAGLAVLRAGHVSPRRLGPDDPHRDPEDFRGLMRDIYISPADVGFWQGAMRAGDEDRWPGVRDAVRERRAFTVELLYGDFEGGQLTITRFGLFPPEDDGELWLVSVGRHWNLEGSNPRG